MRSMVEGFYAARRSSDRKDMLNYTFEVCEYVNCRNAKDLNTLRPQPNVPTLVMLGSIRTVVCLTVDLNCQPQLRAEKVQHIGPGRMLAPEFQTTGPPAKCLP